MTHSELSRMIQVHRSHIAKTHKTRRIYLRNPALSETYRVYLLVPLHHLREMAEYPRVYDPLSVLGAATSRVTRNLRRNKQMRGLMAKLRQGIPKALSPARRPQKKGGGLLLAFLQATPFAPCPISVC
jgi:hypothetical protein